MRSIAPLFTGFALTVTVACIGAAPAQAGGDIGIRPASVRPGDLVAPSVRPLLGGLVRPDDTPKPGEDRASSRGVGGFPLMSSGRPAGLPMSGTGLPGKRRVGEHRTHRPRPAGDRHLASTRAKEGRSTRAEDRRRAREALARAFSQQRGDISRTLTGRSDGMPNLPGDRLAKIHRLLGGRPSPIGYLTGGMR
jgi:hypothetical protein